MNIRPNICILVPCYNEAEVLPSTAETLFKIISDMTAAGLVTESSTICFVNDGSTDSTWNIIQDLMKQSRVFRGIDLSRNFGHQAALLSGLFTVRSDAVISIDADLQDDERMIPQMVENYIAGDDIVYGCRNDRLSDTWFKRYTAQLFYGIRSRLGCKTIPDHGDFRLMSARAIQALRAHAEVNIYIRGIIPLLGFKTSKVYYRRKPRLQGESKYPVSKMLALALNGILNFSVVPLQLSIAAGLIALLFCLFISLWAFLCWCSGAAISGWTSLLIVICALGGLNLLCIGIVGLYLGKVLLETKHRPIYIIRQDCTSNLNESNS